MNRALPNFSQPWRAHCALLLLAPLTAISAFAQQRYAASGLVLGVDQQHRIMTVSCEGIPGYMDAMIMPIEVREAKELDGLMRGAMIEFSLVVGKENSYAEAVHIKKFESLDADPLSARRLRLLDGALDPALSADRVLKIGQPAPDFSLIDQNRARVTLFEFSGKVVAITFVYTRCPFPNFCFRLTNNFARLQKRFAREMGRELILLTITLDPIHDQPEALAAYGRTWNIDPQGWHLLTGPAAEVQKFCDRFGVAFYPDEGEFIHSLHTLVIDRQGKVAANLEGNEFTTEELGDLVQSVMKSSAASPGGL